MANQLMPGTLSSNDLTTSEKHSREPKEGFRVRKALAWTSLMPRKAKTKLSPSPSSDAQKLLDIRRSVVEGVVLLEIAPPPKRGRGARKAAPK